MSVCMFLYACVFVLVSVYAFRYVCVCMCMCVGICVCLCICVFMPVVSLCLFTYVFSLLVHCVFVSACICMCLCVLLCVCTNVCTCACRGQRVTSCIFLNYSLLTLSVRVSHWTWNSSTRLDWLAPGSSPLCLHTPLDVEVIGGPTSLRGCWEPRHRSSQLYSQPFAHGTSPWPLSGTCQQAYWTSGSLWVARALGWGCSSFSIAQGISCPLVLYNLYKALVFQSFRLRAPAKPFLGVLGSVTIINVCFLHFWFYQSPCWGFQNCRVFCLNFVSWNFFFFLTFSWSLWGFPSGRAGCVQMDNLITTLSLSWFGFPL